MTQTAKISNFAFSQEDGQMHLTLVTEIVADEEEIAGITYRMRRDGAVALAGEIENIAYNLFERTS